MKKTRGYTLVELIAVLAVFGIVSLAITAFLSFNMRSYQTAEKRLRLQGFTDEAIDYCSDYAKQSSSIELKAGWYVFRRDIVTDNGIGSEDIFFVLYDTEGKSLTLDFNSEHNDGNEIVYGSDRNATASVFSISPADGAAKLEEASSVKIAITLDDERVSYSNNTEAVLRNR